MKRATITIPDDLEDELEAFLVSQETRPSLTGVFETALRRYLQEKGLALRQFRPPSRPLVITPAEKGSGLTDVSEKHDLYLVSDE